MTTAHLAKKKCKEVTKPLSKSQIRKHLKNLNDWVYAKGAITKTFSFKNYYETVSFDNAVAWIANTQDHHPDMSFGYKQCRIEYSTHSIKGISENDFICAAKIDQL